jgi:high affinity Mn2+ porin
MKRRSPRLYGLGRAWKRLLISAAATVALAAGDDASAADVAVKMPARAPIVAQYDWSGPYVGFHYGYGGGTFGPDTNPLPLKGVALPFSITGLVGGFQAGFNHQFVNGVVVGFEADMTFASPVDQLALIPAPFNASLNYFATARGRLGYAFGPAMPYVTAGLAWGQSKIDINDQDGFPIFAKSWDHLGWTAGIGFEVALKGNWTAKLEYDYVRLGTRTYSLDPPAPPTVAVDPSLSMIKAGLNYRLWDPPSSPTALVTKAPQKAAAPTFAPESDDFSIHAQTTFLPQTYPSFRSPYQGTNSLPGKSQMRETWTNTAFLGWRMWDGGEVYFNPEIAQGFGLGSTLGLAGFSNGEAQKGGAPFPRLRAQRYFLRQTFGLGGEQETVEDGPNQLAGKRDIDRVTLTVGRFAIGDYFDANAYAHDPRLDFMNWALWASAAYDFPADLPGFTRGAVVELNRKDWALRAGVFQVPKQQNSDDLRWDTGGAIVEWEGRYTIREQPGKLRVGVFANRGNTGNYNEALAIVAADPTIDINDAMASTRQVRPKQGAYVNLEQAINKDVGVFARASWNDGRNEILSFTDIDRSLSGGVSIMGSAWGRPNDRVGLGGAVNGLSAAHRDFIAAGGLGLLIGDGALNYRPEKILETFYAISINRWTTLTFDYQFIADPAYNADRGPVSLFAARAHAEF